MPRPKRVITPGCVYEIMQQGNNGVNVVKSYEDRLYLESLLKHYAHRYKIELHKVDIYPNILRLIVMPGTADGLPRFMHAVTCKYARDFNRKYNRKGHLWQDRYSSSVSRFETSHSSTTYYLDKECFTNVGPDEKLVVLEDDNIISMPAGH